MRIVALALGFLASCAPEAPVDSLESYRISTYLDAAGKLQELDVAARTTALRALARDRKRASDVFPLCRMLFAPGKNGEFRRPQLGAAVFLGGTTYEDWPLEPLTIYQGIPILIVTGYGLAGEPEPPESYVEDCLKSRAWSTAKFVSMDRPRRRVIVRQFIDAHPRLAGDADRLLRQAD